MEIVASAHLLAMFESAGALGHISELFGGPHWLLTPGEQRALKREKGADEKKLPPHLPASQTSLQKKERRLIRAMKRKAYALSKGEIEAIAIAKTRNALVFAEDAACRDACASLAVNYMTLPMLMKALWAKKILGKKQVWEIIDKLEKNGGLKFQKVEMILGEGP